MRGINRHQKLFHWFNKPLLILGLFAAFTLFSGCQYGNSTKQRMEQRYNSLSLFQGDGKPKPKEVTEWQLQLRLMAFSDRLLAELSDASDQLKAISETPEQRVAAHRVKLLPATSAIINAADPNPDMALLNMYVTIVLEKIVWRERWGEEWFPGQCDALYEKHDSLEVEITGILNDVLPQERIEELHTYVCQWWNDHPDTSFVAFIRFDEFALEFRKRNRTMALNMLTISNNIDRATAAVDRAMYLGERAIYISERLPTLMRWQAEMAVLNIAASPELNIALNSMKQISTSTNDLHTVLEQFPDQIAKEREQALLQIKQLLKSEREALFTALDERSDSLQQILTDGATVAQSTESAASELNTTAESLNQVVTSTSQLLERFDQALNNIDQLATKFSLEKHLSIDEESGVNNVLVYAKMAEDLSSATKDLKELSQTVEVLLESPKWEDRLKDINEATKTRIDSFYYRIIYLIIFFWIGGVIPVFAYFFYRDWQRAKRRRISQSRDS